MRTVRAVTDSHGNPVIAGGVYTVTGDDWQQSERVTVRKVSRRGSVTVVVFGTGAVTGDVVVRLSRGRVRGLAFTL